MPILKLKALFILLILLILFIISANIVTAQRNSRSQIEVKLFFSNPSLPGYADDCGAGNYVKRTIPAAKQVADAALRVLFAGPDAAEKARGMESNAPLGDYYLGVTIRKGVAIVNFRKGAERYLYVDGPLCKQDMVLKPIVETLKQFRSVKSVDYAIEGKIIEEWDA